MLQNDSIKRQIESQKQTKGNAALIVAVPRSDPESAETARLIRELRGLDSSGLQSFITVNRVDIMDRISRAPRYGRICDGSPLFGSVRCFQIGSPAAQSRNDEASS